MTPKLDMPPKPLPDQDLPAFWWEDGRNGFFYVYRNDSFDPNDPWHPVAVCDTREWADRVVDALTHEWESE